MAVVLDWDYSKVVFLYHFSQASLSTLCYGLIYGLWVRPTGEVPGR